MRRPVFLASARRDLADTYRYITTQSGSRKVGRSFVAVLSTQCAKLAALPGTLGRPRPDIGAGIRSFPYRGYVIFFRYDGDIFEVVSVLEGHRDVIGHVRDEDG